MYLTNIAISQPLFPGNKFALQMKQFLSCLNLFNLRGRVGGLYFDMDIFLRRDILREPVSSLS